MRRLERRRSDPHASDPHEWQADFYAQPQRPALATWRGRGLRWLVWSMGRNLPRLLVWKARLVCAVTAVGAAAGLCSAGKWDIGIPMALTVVALIGWPYLLASAHSPAIALEQAMRGDLLIVLFRSLQQDCQDFMQRLPDRSEYDNWRTETARQIAGFSLSLAAEWSAAEPATVPRGLDLETIQLRLDLINALHRRVANEGVSGEELTAAGFVGRVHAPGGHSGLRELLRRLGAGRL